MDRLTSRAHPLSIRRALTLTLLLACLASVATANVVTIGAVASTNVAATSGHHHQHRAPLGDFAYLATTLECTDSPDPVAAVVEIAPSLRTLRALHLVHACEASSSFPLRVRLTVLRI